MKSFMAHDLTMVIFEIISKSYVLKKNSNEFEI